MNTLGKILVFINLLFSLVTGALIIMVFITRSHWQVGYNNLSTRLVRERESHIAAVNLRNEMEAKKNEELALVKNELKASDDKRVKAEDAARTARQNELKAQDLAAAAAATIAKLQTMNQNREAEVKKIDALLAESTKENVKLVQSNKVLTDRAVAAEIKNQSMNERNQNLMLQVQNLLKQMESIRLGEAARTSQLVRNPPPEDIKGRIKAADLQSGLVTINLGSDSGLSKGNTLEVFRLAPKPTYLGTLRITDVRPNEAVGRLVSSRRGALQVGDEVASEILGRR